jgi:lipopolysaccharide biosynthesis glycosyltransferase
MNIVYCTDNNYLKQCLISICSICENNENINFYILHNGLSQKNLIIMEQFLKKYATISVQLIEIKDSLFSSFPIGKENQTTYVSLATYYRLYLADILPDTIEKVIYLDCDVIVTDSMIQLWHTDVSNFAVAAVPDTNTYDIQTYNRLHYNPELGYFNAGVLLINLNFWRKNNITKLFLQCVKENYDKLQWHDQDVLNLCLKNNKTRLPFTFNFQEGFLRKQIPLFYIEWNEIFKVEKKPTIIHYTGSSKPWQSDCKNPLKTQYLFYKSLTPYKNDPLEDLPKKIIIKNKIRKLLSILKLCKAPVICNPYR